MDSGLEGVRNQGSVPEAPSLGSWGRSFSPQGNTARITFVGEKAHVGCGREEPGDEPLLMLPSLTDLQGVDNTTDILLWNLQGRKQKKGKKTKKPKKQSVLAQEPVPYLSNPCLFPGATHQCMVELESTDVICRDVCSCQGLRDLGYNSTLV